MLGWPRWRIGAHAESTGHPMSRAGALALRPDILLGIPVSAGWVDKAGARVSAQLGKAGFGEASRSPS